MENGKGCEMKIYISADMEGIAGITHWDETEKGHETYPAFSKLMTREVIAACEGALEAGAEEIWIKDAHETGRNIMVSELPPEAILIRGWSGHPYSMVQELDESFSALILIGYHAPAGSDGDPLAHTISRKVSCLKINGDLFSEFRLVAYTASLLQVPVIFVSGDEFTCLEAKELISDVETVATKSGRGNSTISIAPRVAQKRIRKGVRAAVGSSRNALALPIPDQFDIEVEYTSHGEALRNSFYPRARLCAANRISYEVEDFLQVLRFISFVIG